MVFVIEVGDQFFDVVDMVIKTVKIIYFFSYLCSKSVFSNKVADGYKFVVFVPFR